MFETTHSNSKSIFVFAVLTTLLLGLMVWLLKPISVAANNAIEPTIQGGLYFQNNTANNLWVAVGYADSAGNWFSQGWVKLEPGEKRRALAGYLTHRYYTYYARTANESRIWTGNRQFWVRNQDWAAIPAGLDPNQAATEGFQSRGFQLIDLGQPCESFTVEVW